MAQSTKQFRLVETEAVPGQDFEPAAFFDANGDPVEIGGGGEPGPEGPQGPEGPEGPEGPQGPQGPAGEVTQAEFDALEARVAALEAGA